MSEILGSIATKLYGGDADAVAGLVQQALDQAQADLEAARDKLVALEEEPEHRATRLTEIPGQIAGAQHDLDEIESQLAALPLPQEPAALTDARRTKLQAERLALNAQIAVWNAERAKYEARGKLLPLQHDRWQRRVTHGEKLVAAWQSIVDRQRSLEADQQRREAVQAEALAHPLVQLIAA